MSATQGRRKTEVCVLGEIEGGRGGDGGQLKDHPMRGDLKASVRFYEIGLGATRAHAHTGRHIHSQVVSLKQKLCQFQTALMFLSLKIPRLLCDTRLQGSYSGYCNPRKSWYIFKILTAEVLISRLLQIFVGCFYSAAAFSKLCMIPLSVKFEGSAGDAAERTVILAVLLCLQCRTSARTKQRKSPCCDARLYVTRCRWKPVFVSPCVCMSGRT